jgi:hypothetical protein
MLTVMATVMFTAMAMFAVTRMAQCMGMAGKLQKSQYLLPNFW